MSETDIFDIEIITTRLQQQSFDDKLRITIHAYQEMVEEDILYDSIREAISNGRVIENYPEHQRGSCCLVCGKSGKRYLHVVCTTSLEVSVIITVYEPKPPKWITPFQRGR